MARVKRSVTSRAKHKKTLGRAKGYYNARRKNIKSAKQAVMKAGQYAFRRFMNGLKKAKIDLDRKVLADIAVFDKDGFAALAEKAKASLS